MTTPPLTAMPNDVIQRIDLSYSAIGISSPSSIQPHLIRPRSDVVIIDALRSTTTDVAVLAAGATHLLIEAKPPEDATVDVADIYRHLFDDGTSFVIGGEKHGRPLPGAAFGNSILADFVPTRVDGAVAIKYSTNGGHALSSLKQLVAGSQKPAVYLATFANHTAVAARLRERGRQVVIVNSAFYGRCSLEDAVVGGRVLRSLGFPDDQLDDDALLMALAADRFGDDAELLATLYGHRIGTALAHYGHTNDIDAAVTGRGVDSALWTRMRHTVPVATWFGDIPVITARS
ncbi:2-phosphosulfolactate phosphatase [Streptomyces sp. NPDC002688]|uniref:2-phosphosulfolactate phosphatase n=1 Tax=Streptomyces sp. NPDC002688 TaxID=3154423 RepID=UPI0033345AF4